ncbi:MAG: hypothetical protein HOP28_02685 [Gemmatimonadales bacterium]|nr:hypothetical protein [Gemmatimonadales bacterium]
MPTNFDLAPPSKTVDGLAAVPIDIQHIAATLVFDGATSSGSGDATIDFVVGPGGGCPIFDLRQTIVSVSLDGAPLTPADAALHDFGGGTDAELRILNQPLTGGSAHSLRLTYSLGTPQASTLGSYQPRMTWSAGPRLAFNFGFTDLGPGRYLESWVPANLIFDQYDLTLDLQVTNTGLAHVPITNGTVTVLGANHWSIAFPARFTAFSPLLELRAEDTVVSQTGSVVLPLSGATIALEAWKLTAGTANLGAQLTNIANFLVANEASTGPYVHGNRFVAFLHQGGMEYDGGITTGVGALQHETFHSWWGRGLKPASQPDAWWDEAWNVYNDNGAAGSLPFDFSGAAVELNPLNPWVRRTASASYSSGERFFRGAAAFMGVPGLTAGMRAFYEAGNERPVPTTALEEHLVARCADPSLVDAFHRFVYGFPDPSPAPDLWIKDDPGHAGSDHWAGTFWNSPDLWIRNADDGGTTHQPPEQGQDNWFYARVRNRSASATARHFVVVFNTMPWAGTEFTFPGDFLPATAAVAGFDLGPGETRIVKARWPRAKVPAKGTHVCWVAAALTRGDPPGTGLHVWEHNNLAQKNMVVVDAVPDRWVVFPFLLERRLLWRRRKAVLRLHRPPRWAALEAAILHDGDLFEGPARRIVDAGALTLEASARARLDCGGDAALPMTREAFESGLGRRFPKGKVSELPLELPGRGQLLVGLALRVPAGMSPGESPPIDLVQWDPRGKRAVGGLSVILRVPKARGARRGAAEYPSSKGDRS